MNIEFDNINNYASYLIRTRNTIMGPIGATAIFNFVIGYLGGISAHEDLGDCSVCGIDQPEPTPSFMIRDGKTINDTKTFPWMVSLRNPNDPDKNRCGGAILDEYFILTAAHCVTSFEGDQINLTKVYFQTHSVKKMCCGADIEKLIIHPKYEFTVSNSTGIFFIKYDIALVKLKKKIKCDMYKRPICLPSPDLKIPPGRENVIAGWGDTGGFDETQSEVLRYGTVKHLNFSRCILQVPEIYTIKDHALCLGVNKQIMCLGDTGDPLIDKINSKYTVVGVGSSITSKPNMATEVHCPISTPIIYTNVAKFVKWIKQHQRATLVGSKQTQRQRNSKRRYRKRNSK